MNSRDHLLKHDIRPSVQRMAVMDYLLTHKTHPTVEEIYSALHPSIPTLSKTTVYNTLKLFVENGAALYLTIDEKNARFDGDTSAHAHFICSGCGCIHDLPVSGEQKTLFANEIGGLMIQEVQIYYKGYCKTCQEKRNQPVLHD